MAARRFQAAGLHEEETHCGKLHHVRLHGFDDDFPVLEQQETQGKKS